MQISPGSQQDSFQLLRLCHNVMIRPLSERLHHTDIYSIRSTLHWWYQHSQGRVFLPRDARARARHSIYLVPRRRAMCLILDIIASVAPVHTDITLRLPDSIPLADTDYILRRQPACWYVVLDHYDLYMQRSDFDGLGLPRSRNSHEAVCGATNVALPLRSRARAIPVIDVYCSVPVCRLQDSLNPSNRPSRRSAVPTSRGCDNGGVSRSARFSCWLTPSTTTAKPSASRGTLSP